MIFTKDGVDHEALARLLDAMLHVDRSNKYEDMSCLVSAAVGYDALCAGVNKSIGAAFKEEGASIPQGDGDSTYGPFFGHKFSCPAPRNGECNCK